MPIELRVPSLGESITEATIGAWLKKEGEPVGVDEPVVEVESEKATVAVPAPAAGVITRVLKQSGATVAVGEVIAVLEEGAAAAAEAPTPGAPVSTSAPVARPGSAASAPAGEAPAAPAQATAPAQAAPTPARAPASGGASTPQHAATPAAAAISTSPATARSAGSDGKPLRVPPSVRRHIAETGVDPRGIVGKPAQQPGPAAPRSRTRRSSPPSTRWTCRR
jgi:2-oxoglutarate dehydrogenase E2 component (dihydrolipoamide succinyltransferase)